MHTRVSSLVARVIRENTGHDLDPAVQEPLVTSGYIDSITMVSLVSALQDEFDVELDMEDMVVENFETIRAITDLVERRAGRESA